MHTVLQQPYASSYSRTKSKPSTWFRFIEWCGRQNEFRFVWLSVILVSNASLFTPLTLYVIMSTGNSMIAWMFAITAMAMALVTNLAALPTKITIPTYVLSLVINVVVIALCLMGLFQA